MDWVDFGQEDRLNAASKLMRSPSKDGLSHLLCSPSRISPHSPVGDSGSPSRVVDLLDTRLVFDDSGDAVVHSPDSAEGTRWATSARGAPKLSAVRMDAAPFTILDTLRFSRIHHYFTMLSLRCVS